MGKSDNVKDDRTDQVYHSSENGETKGVEVTLDYLNDLFNKVPKGLAAALRLAAICYNSHEIKRLVSLDKAGCNFMHDISEACCTNFRIA